ncbi:hypothetical protein [Klebsiella aerogenes]|uniref:hypothetical protein n=2 Tax=Gammaproteobacteria TaxID=1236 RepID=UPI00378CEA27
MKLRTIAGLALAGIIASGVGYHAWTDHVLKRDLAQAIKERDEARESAKALKAANDAFSDKLNAQNAAVAELKRQADLREAKAKEASAAALADAKRKLADAQKLLGRPMPVPGSACKSAEVLLDEAIKGRA